MAIFNEEQVLKILNAYNPWWKNSQIPSDYLREMKRTAYYEAERIIMNEYVRRFIILSGARRVGKTTILYQLIQKLIQPKVDETTPVEETAKEVETMDEPQTVQEEVEDTKEAVDTVEAE